MRVMRAMRHPHSFYANPCPAERFPMGTDWNPMGTDWNPMGTDWNPMGTKKTQLGTELQENAFYTQKHEIDLSSITFCT
jgi:hypothetical protein